MQVVVIARRRRVEITTAFLGVVGTVSPLATAFTDDVVGGQDEDLRAFYDVFHHRLLGIFFKARRLGTPANVMGRDGRDRSTQRLLCAVGIQPHDDRAHGVEPLEWLALGRLMHRRAQSADALEAALALAFPDGSVRWRGSLQIDRALSPAQRTRVARGSSRLGRSVRLGGRLRQQLEAVLVEVRASAPAVVDDYLSNGPSAERLLRVVGAVTGGGQPVVIELELVAGAEPRARLGSRFDRRLGVNCALMRSRQASDAPMRVRIELGSGDARAIPTTLELP